MSNVLFDKVEEAIVAEQGAHAAINFGVILQLISTLMPIITNCFGAMPSRASARAVIRGGGDAVKIGIWRAVVASGYEGDRGSLTMRLAESATKATDQEIDEALETAAMFPA